jgi:peptidoglycan/LPS O-acetylase OafA/YrhL
VKSNRTVQSAAGARKLDKGFRPDIEGLRAVAVISVVLYHLNFPSAPGGFVGVDVFFTISGFLMTEIITKEIQKGKFDLRQFFQHRILRIWPAMLVAILATLLVGLFLLPPIELAELGKSAIASLLMGGNVLFWLQSSYFAPAAEGNPLLHLWSLGVEQQFYVLVPLLVPIAVMGWRKDRRWTVVAMAIASFTLCIIMTPQKPVASFYLLPTRIWEFLLGSCVALYRAELVVRASVTEIGSAAGVGMIITAVLFLNGRLQFPGYWALLPCLGAALVIAANAGALTLAGRALASVPCVVIGRLSYSIYLWHWPNLTFCRLEGASIESGPVRLLILVSTLGCSYLSWRFVEAPFRNSTVLSPKQRFVGLAATMSVLAVASAVVVASGGAPIRLDRQTRDLVAYQDYSQKSSLYREGECFLRMDQPASDFDWAKCGDRVVGRANLLLWGDSHAAHYAYGMHEMASRFGIDVVQATYAGCAPIAWRVTNSESCADFGNKIRGLALAQKFDAVVISANWTGYPGILPELSTLVRDLAQMGRFTVVIGPSVEFTKSLPTLLVAAGFGVGIAGRQPSDWLTDAVVATDRRMREMFVGVPNVFYISPVTEACPAGICPVLLENRIPLTWDASHLTAEGSILISSLLLEKLSPVIRKHISQAQKSNL